MKYDTMELFDLSKLVGIVSISYFFYLFVITPSLQRLSSYFVLA